MGLDPNEAIVANLKNFVNQGGSIYASDWASEVVEVMYPDKIQFLGLKGEKQTITASITNGSASFNPRSYVRSDGTRVAYMRCLRRFNPRSYVRSDTPG